MARIDDYKEAARLAVEELKKRDPEDIAKKSGAKLEYAGNKPVMALSFLNRELLITFPDFECRYRDTDEELPIQQKVLLLHYLKGAKGNDVTGHWVAYQEIPDGMFYLDAFLRRAKNPMVQVFGEDPDLLMEITKDVYDARPFEHGDVSMVIQALPYVPVVLILWRGDDDFPPEGNLLFDKNIIGIFSAEDIAWLAGMIIYPVIGMAERKRKNG